MKMAKQSFPCFGFLRGVIEPVHVLMGVSFQCRKDETEAGSALKTAVLNAAVLSF